MYGAGARPITVRRLGWLRRQAKFAIARGSASLSVEMLLLVGGASWRADAPAVALVKAALFLARLLHRGYVSHDVLDSVWYRAKPRQGGPVAALRDLLTFLQV